MDCHKIQPNGHNKKEEFKSGSAKRKIAKEKEKNEEVIVITDYMKFNSSSSAAPKNKDYSCSPTSLSQPQNFEDGELIPEIPAEVPAPSVSELETSTELKVSLEPALVETVCLENDIEFCPEFMTPGNVDYCIKMGSTALQNGDGYSKEVGCIDQELTWQAEDVAKYWREVLRRLINPRNCNYLGLLELIAEYGDFLSSCIKNKRNCGNGRTNYLSSTICEEVVQLIGERVFNEVISRIKQSTILNTSLTVTFMPNQGHKAIEMFQSLSKFWKQNDIDIKSCHVQSYDSASSMSRKNNGLQVSVLAKNSSAVWVPCARH
ncbi:hypothetical protein PR048_030508 [Dryococelus australis]|uniref:DUF4371 domain-containing protein n=1 Tax=Dryococelus australis TaxID=614101 RepID=A0ABQ9G9Z4_9NEOP|nr:hypothetical protein PR048_030508 [Dryococelus australis]